MVSVPAPSMRAPMPIRHFGQLDDLGFAGGVFQDGFPLGRAAVIIRCSVPPTVEMSK